MSDLRITAALAGAAAASFYTSLATDDSRAGRWAVHTGSLDLYAERGPDDRLLLLNCGGAIHRAVVCLAADGFAAGVTLLPAGDSDHIATLVPAGEIAITDRARQLVAAADNRPSLRPPARDRPTGTAIDGLVEIARAAGTGMQVLAARQVLALAAATTMPRKVRERVGRDESAVYAVLYGNSAETEAWLRAGMALAAVWLEAMRQGLSVSPSTSVVELRGGRVIRRMLPPDSTAYVAIRIEVTADNARAA